MLYERCVACTSKKICHNNSNLVKIFTKSLEAVDTRRLIKNNVKCQDNTLIVRGQKYGLKGDVFLVGFGKAVMNMALELEGILGEKLARGVCSVPAGLMDIGENRKLAERSVVEFYEGAKGNFPDLEAVQATRTICDLVKSLGEEDLLVVLISGGGSALLSFPKDPLTLEEKSSVVQFLSKAGADIFELNAVRKRLSEVKGGGLARMAFPTKVLTLILSDVIGNPVQIIASGPTVPPSEKPKLAGHILKKYALAPFPEALQAILDQNQDVSSIPLSPCGDYFHVDNHILASNHQLTEAAKLDAIRRNYQSCVLTVGVQGEVWSLSKKYVSLAMEICELMKGFSSIEHFSWILENSFQESLCLTEKSMKELVGLDFGTPHGVCLIFGGETTVKVRGGGKGGRNTHLALRFSIDLHEAMTKTLHSDGMNISLLSCGTDGIDGPTDAAGAVGFSGLYEMAREQDLFPRRFLRNFDSYSFFEKISGGKYLIKTGHTGTNVMDLHVLVINKGYDFDSDLDEDMARTIRHACRSKKVS